jgi:small GTP-binding protein
VKIWVLGFSWADNFALSFQTQIRAWRLCAFFFMSESRNEMTARVRIDYDLLVKVVVIGDAGVGKTKLCDVLADKEFDSGFGATIGIDFHILGMEKSGKKMKIQLWDTAGSERFRSITKSYYRLAHIVYVVFDCRVPQSLDGAASWLREARQHNPDIIHFVLAGQKSDLGISDSLRSAAKKMAAAEQMTYIETSAKSGSGIEVARDTIATMGLLPSTHHVFLRKAHAELAAQELGLIFEATRTFAGVRVPRDVLGLLQRAVLATAAEGVWDLPTAEKKIVREERRGWWRSLLVFFSGLIRVYF